MFFGLLVLAADFASAEPVAEMFGPDLLAGLEQRRALAAAGAGGLVHRDCWRRTRAFRSTTPTRTWN